MQEHGGPTCRAAACLAFLALLALCHPAGLQAANEHVAGRWLGPYGGSDWGVVAIHMALLPGDGVGHQAQVLFWDRPGRTSRVWLWSPGAVPTADKMLPASTGNQVVYCSGHSALASGDLLVAGGEWPVVVGLEHTYLYNPFSRTWSQLADMTYTRWYPTVTTLGDSRALVTAGNQYWWMTTFGGRDTAGVPQDSLIPLSQRETAFWGEGALLGAAKPAAREGHGTCYDSPSRRMLVFGGRAADGTRNDAWEAVRRDDVSDSDQLSVWQWRELRPDPDPAGYPDTLPPPRWRHTAVFNPVDTSVVVFGGRDGAGSPLGDVWKLHLKRSRVTPSNPDGQWTRFSPAAPGGPPAPRWGHAAAFDPGPPGGANLQRMLVFGGEPAGGEQDGTVWALSLADAVQPPTWSELALRAGSPRPPLREGHAAILDDNPPRGRPRQEGVQVVNERRLVAFAGRSSGTHLDEVWMLWIPPETTHPNLLPLWQPVTPDPDPAVNPGQPAPRAELSAIYDPQWKRAQFYGGETAAGLTDQVWAFNLDYYQPSGERPRWVRVLPASPPGGRAGHTAIYDPEPLDALIPEIFDPATAQWQKQPQLRKKLPTYPYMFVLPSGALFYAGPGINPQLLDLATGWGAVHPSSFGGGSAALYDHGRVLKCGGTKFFPGQGYLTVGATARIAFDPVTNATTGWQDLPAMSPRINHNLTVLPTGDVLVTGGETADKALIGDSTVAVKPAQIWSPLTGSWTANLAGDPAVRGYHSTALLLPDARILSAGGGPSPGTANQYQLMATVYEPPYLFDANDSTAARPQIQHAPSSVFYGDSFLVCTPEAASIMGPKARVCLIKPSAVTHAFNEDQRYVPLSYEVLSCAGGSALKVRAPAGGNWAPPGYYMLFIVNGSGVPSVAKWVKLQAGGSGAPPSCAECFGGGCPFVDLRTPRGWEERNSILGRSAGDSLMTDACPLGAEPLVVDGRYELRIRESEREHTVLDRAALVAVDHRPEVSAFLIGQRPVLGTRVGPRRAVAAGGRDVTALVAAVDGVCFVGGAGETLYVDPPSGKRRTGLGGEAAAGHGPGVIDDGEKTAGGGGAGGGGEILAATGILVQVPDGSGGWRTLQHRHAREHVSDFAFDSLGAGPWRLVFLDRHRVDFAGRIAVSQDVPAVSWLEPATARHRRLGDVRESLMAAGDARVPLRPGDELTLGFAAPPLAEGQARDLFLVTRGYYSSAPAPAGEAAAVPDRIGLEPSRPNPFTDRTALRFALPRGTPVRLEVHDLLGRRVRRLVDAALPAGEHAAAWDGRDEDGRRVGAGVYVVRLRAGASEARQKVVRLP